MTNKKVNVKIYGIALLIEIWGYSSAGRALEWHSRGQRFDPAYLHQLGSLGSIMFSRLSLFVDLDFFWDENEAAITGRTKV